MLSSASAPQPAVGGDPTSSSSSSSTADRDAQTVDEIVRSDIGVTTLLTRLKQSIAATTDAASFFKKRATQEDRSAQELRKLCHSTTACIRRPESRHGTYAAGFEELTRIHETLADNGTHFAQALNTMYDDLSKMIGSMEHSRKQWKSFGLLSEKRVQDAEAQADKARARVEGLQDGSGSGGTITGKFAGFKAARQGLDPEERIAQANEEFQAKQQTARALRQELIQSQRPQAVHALRDMIDECDAGLAAHLQKYGEWIRVIWRV